MDAFNPFDPTYEGSNIERILVDVYRKSETELTTFDFKVSNNELFELGAGSVAGLIGFEWRKEEYRDDRDPRLDGTIVFTDYQGDTYPYVSDVVNSSPTGDSSALVTSHQCLPSCRFHCSTIWMSSSRCEMRTTQTSAMATSLGKAAFGYRPVESL